MHILLTNDDGVHAPGLRALERIAAALKPERVTVVAPEYDQSGVAHSLSLNDPLRLREIGPDHYAVKGTPTDCVIMAIHRIFEGRRPDLVLSGVNRGHNVAEDVTYSGTVAGAMEGTILGAPSIALSQSYSSGDRESVPWATAERHGPDLIRRILAAGVGPGTLINVNFPNCGPDEVKGVSVCAQGKRDAALLRIEERRDGRHIPYYWIGFERQRSTPPPGSDLAALAERRIAVTPLRVDLTDTAALTHYALALGRER
jgi:5'-nucleotidase